LANLLEDPGSKLGERIVLHGVRNFDGVTADFAIFHIDLAANRQVENHRNLLPAIWADKEVFHEKSMHQRIDRRHGEIVSGKGRAAEIVLNFAQDAPSER
jgi:hypothetical protein